MEGTEVSSCMQEEDILDMIFNPGGLPINKAERLPEPIATCPYDSSVLAQSKSMELKAVSAVEERHDLDAALSLLKDAESLTQDNPSVLNNIAQVLSLKGDVDSSLSYLEKAIALPLWNPLATRQAHIQRALIFELKGDIDKARADYEKAASMGSSFAKKEAARLNPYARLCNEMMTQAMKELHFS